MKIQDMEWKVGIESIIYSNDYEVYAHNKNMSITMNKLYTTRNGAVRAWNRFAVTNGITKYKYVD